MTQEERLDELVRLLLAEDPYYREMEVPEGYPEKRRLLRALMNLRPPQPTDESLLELQDQLLREELAQKRITRPEEIPACGSDPRLSVWRGDITTLAADAIVNAANDRMVGCFHPCHGCIDNAIHSAAGIRLRLECAELMRMRGGEPEPTGGAEITRAYCLPCRYVLHTVGPIVEGGVEPRQERELADCYRNCLGLARNFKLKTVAFCCISTGEYHFPRELAAQIAVRTVKEELDAHPGEVERVIFNVFTQEDDALYRALLG